LKPATPGSWTGHVILTRGSGFGIDYGFALLDVYTTATGGTPLSFNGTDNKFLNGNIPAGGLPLYVEGAHFSYLMRDGWLKAEAEGLPGSADSVKFTVLYVEQPEVRFDGSVSASNARKPNYMAITENHDDKIGPRTIREVEGKKAWVWAFEVSGDVHPADFQHWAVKLPPLGRGRGGDLRLERDVYVRYWRRLGATGAVTEFLKRDFTSVNDIQRNPKGNDTSPSTWRDDDSRQDGKIYDLDNPGIRVDQASDAEVKSIYRVRFNARSFATATVAAYGDNYFIRVGPTRAYWLRFSIIRKSNQQWDWDFIPMNDPDYVTGDHKAGYGSTPVSWNLQ
jgi:hypothetical protein